MVTTNKALVRVAIYRWAELEQLISTQVMKDPPAIVKESVVPRIEYHGSPKIFKHSSLVIVDEFWTRRRKGGMLMEMWRRKWIGLFMASIRSPEDLTIFLSSLPNRVGDILSKYFEIVRKRIDVPWWFCTSPL
jgi:hypothetical protein